MSYAPINCYSAAKSERLDNVVNKFYVNIGTVNVNNGNVNHGIQHSIAAERTGDIKVYNQSIDNRVQNNYVLNLDNRKVEFVSPYICDARREGSRYLEDRSGYLLPKPSCDYDSEISEYRSNVTTGLLKRNRPATQFVEDAEEIEDIVRETFVKLTGQTFPDEIIVRVLNEKDLRKAHESNGGKWSSGILGFAINGSCPRVFVRKNHLDSLMLTVGHEIGHVMSPVLPDSLDEEAKAFAFELAWAKCIVDNDIGGMAHNFDTEFMPAENGLHDRAFAFVQDVVNKGKDSFKVFWELAKGVVRVRV
ncbi:hypothetical protein HQ545_04350 [Candidatus Woesearchaeota archaeon]|nr:hypothetical protein [Candidatus Woesearchaeota archaeon]